MDLFNSTSTPQNLLPQDGNVLYYGPLMPAKKATHYFDTLLNSIDWKNDEVIIFGKKIITKRKVGWYGTQPFEYTYSKITRRALPFTAVLEELKELAEQNTGATYNSCLLNLYHTGEESMGWHTDDEEELEPNGAIASFSFGASRKFCFKHKTNATRVDVLLEHGSLLLMKDTTQSHWLHRLPPSKKIQSPRINLTFRTIVTNTK